MSNEPNEIEKLAHNKWVWVGLGIGGIGVIYYFHKRSAADATATTAPTDTSVNDATNGITSDSGSALDYSDSPLDPGYSPVSAENTGGYGLTPSDYMYDPATGEYEYVGNSGTTSTAPTTNAEWASSAESALTSAGYSGTSVATALGKYLLGDELTQDQLGIIQAAIGLIGPTPVPVPEPKVAPSGTSKQPKQIAQPKLSVTGNNTSRPVLHWTKPGGANHVNIYKNGAYSGTSVGSSKTVTDSANYAIVASASDSNKNYIKSAQSNSVSVTVKKAAPKKAPVKK